MRTRRMLIRNESSRTAMDESQVNEQEGREEKAINDGMPFFQARIKGNGTMG